MRKTFWVLVTVIVAGIAVGSWTCRRAGPREGFAVLDASVYLDATNGAEPVASVIEASGARTPSDATQPWRAVPGS